MEQMSRTTSDGTPPSIRYYLGLKDYPREKLEEILDYLAGYETRELKTDDYRREIIRLFLCTFSELTSSDSARPFGDADIKTLSEKARDAYKNIKTISTDMQSPDIFTIVFDFLKSIEENSKLELDRLKETGIDFFRYLAKIEFVFKLKADGAYLFPIGNVLKEILGTKDMLDNARSTYDEDHFFFIIRLALMVFEVSDENKYKEKLRSELKKANLGFLLAENKLNANDDWTYWNFKRNNVMVIITNESCPAVVYVHSAYRSYFGSEAILEEKTAKGVTIGYNWSRTLTASESQKSFDELLNKDDPDINRQLAAIIFDRNQRNVFAPGFLTYDENTKQVQPLNPFTKEDESIISSTSDNASFEIICKKYYTKRLITRGLKSLTFGTLLFLNQLSGKPVSFIFDKVRNSSGVLQNEAIRYYLEEYPADLPDLMRNFEQTMRRFNSSHCKIEDCLLYPIHFDFKDIIVDRVASEKQRQDKKDPIELKAAQVAIESSIPYLKLENGDLLRKEIVDDIPDVNGLPVALVQQGDQYSIEQDYGNEIILLGKIAENRNLLTEDNVSKYNHPRIDCLAELMDSLQWQYVPTKDKFASVNDMCVMRLANHIANCLKEPIPEKVNCFLDTIYTLPRIKGETLKDIERELTSNDTVVVLKSISDYGSTCSSMLHKYIAPEGCHDPSPWSPSKVLEKNQSGRWSYTRSGNPSISKIIFLFDNSISGHSTTVSLRNYFKGKSDAEAYFFRTSSSKIHLKKLIKDNDIKDIDVIVLYATDKAKEKIENMRRELEADYTSINITLRLLHMIKEDSEVLFNRFQELYKPNLLSTKQCTYVLREYNQPKMNWLIDALYKSENPNAIFILDGPKSPDVNQ